jgi:hypothetical protein
MFQRRTQYEPVANASEQHILTVLRFHEARLGKIEKHLNTTNKQLQNLITVYKQGNSVKKPASKEKQVDQQSFSMLKSMMENLTTQVVASQSFMKEIKDVVSKFNSKPVVVEKKKKKEVKPEKDDYYTNHKLLELERDIAKAQLISIGMEPTLERIDEYVERMRRDRKRFLDSEKSKKEKVVESKNEESSDEQSSVSEEEEVENVSDNVVVSSSSSISLDESILAQNIENLDRVKEEVEEEVLDAVEKIPVVIKPRKRRGRPKKN